MLNTNIGHIDTSSAVASVTAAQKPKKPLVFSCNGKVSLTSVSRYAVQQRNQRLQFSA